MFISLQTGNVSSLTLGQLVHVIELALKDISKSAWGLSPGHLRRSMDA